LVKKVKNKINFLLKYDRISSIVNLKRKKEILASLAQEIKKAAKTAKQRREAAKNFRMASRSQQGDRRLLENTADIAESFYLALLEFKKEIEASPNKPCSKIKPVCFVSLEFENGQPQNFYFASKRFELPGLQIIGAGSPLGQAIEGKKKGDSFNYQIKRDDQTITFSGKIVKIE